MTRLPTLSAAMRSPTATQHSPNGPGALPFLTHCRRTALPGSPHHARRSDDNVVADAVAMVEGNMCGNLAVGSQHFSDDTLRALHRPGNMS